MHLTPQQIVEAITSGLTLLVTLSALVARNWILWKKDIAVIKANLNAPAHELAADLKRTKDWVMKKKERLRSRQNKKNTK
jgi:hypothetical protein